MTYSLADKPFQFSLRALFIAVLVVAIAAAISAPYISRIYQDNLLHGYRRHVIVAIQSFHGRCPVDVPADQWREAVDVTANVINHDFYPRNRDKPMVIQQLVKEIDQRAEGNVDLGTLTWIWDACEDMRGDDPCTYAKMFRNVKLLTKGTITDEQLPHAWSLDRCINLDLSGTQITDKSIPYLATLTKLQSLDIFDTSITDNGAEELQKALPNCEILR